MYNGQMESTGERASILNLRDVGIYLLPVFRHREIVNPAWSPCSNLKANRPTVDVQNQQGKCEIHSDRQGWVLRQGDSADRGVQKRNCLSGERLRYTSGMDAKGSHRSRGKGSKTSRSQPWHSGLFESGSEREKEKSQGHH